MPCMKSTYIAIFFAAMTLVWAPSVSANVLVGSVDASALATQSSKPTLSGMVFGATEVRVRVYKKDSTKVLYKSPVLHIENNRWQTQVSKKLADGLYSVEVDSMESQTIVSEVLVVGGTTSTSAASPTGLGSLIVASVPLLSGGVASVGGTVPISYLQMTNTSKNALSLQGFSVRQNGSASAQSVIGFTVVDDQGTVRGIVGGFEGALPFVGQDAFVPTTMILTPGEMRLFTIKATLGRISAAHIGKQLMIDVVSVHTDGAPKGSFPIRGTTWTISK